MVETSMVDAAFWFETIGLHVNEAKTQDILIEIKY